MQVPFIASPAGKILLLTVSVGCFFAALALGVAVFIVAYEHAWRHTPLPLAASAASWIPLGIVGQSTAAAQALAGQATSLSIPEIQSTIQTMANIYGIATLLVGVPLFCWAFTTTAKGFLSKMPFSPGWWATTFPVGTLCLGSHLLAHGTDWGLFEIVSYGLLVLLSVNWLVCVTGSLAAIRTHRQTAGS